MNFLLQVHNLTKNFSSGFWPFKKKQYTAVNDISFHLKKGEILGFLGPNGAGKTTTIQMLLGTLTPTSGSITCFGLDFMRHRIAILKKIGYASGYDKLPGRLTVWENLDVVGRIYGIPTSRRSQQIETLLKLFDMWALKDRATGTLSAGQTTRVMLAKAFIADPEIVLLDEPTASLDPDVAHEVRQFILKCKERGTSILITSHNMDEVTELCDRILVLKNGVIIADDTPQSLATSIAKVRIHLTFSDDCIKKAQEYLQVGAWHYTVHHNEIIIELDEHAIAHFLAQLAEHKIIYSQISIDKPTLEDYFLTIAK